MSGVQICASCQKPIGGACIQALGKAYHPDHFRCSTCSKVLTNKIYQVNGVPTCDECFNQQVSICARCNQPISGQSLKALDKKWHVDCFVCNQCKASIASGTFVDKGGFPYCQSCFSQYAQKCKGCGLQITDKVFTALGEKWHVGCFKCEKCKQPFNGKPVFERNGKPYCEEHVPSNTNSGRALPVPGGGDRPTSKSPGPPTRPKSPRRVPMGAPGTQSSSFTESPELRGGSGSGSGSRRMPPARKSIGSTGIASLVKNDDPDAKQLMEAIRESGGAPTGNRRPVSTRMPRPGEEVPKSQQLQRLHSVATGGGSGDRPEPRSQMMRRTTDSTTLQTAARTALQTSSSNPSSPSLLTNSSTNTSPSLTKSGDTVFFKDDPESQLAQKVLDDLTALFPWFANSWRLEAAQSRENCFNILTKDIHEAMVASKKAGPLQVKSWTTKSNNSFNVTLKQQQYDKLLPISNSLKANITKMLSLVHSAILIDINKQKVNRAAPQKDLDFTAKQVFTTLLSLLAIFEETNEMDALKKFIDTTKKALNDGVSSTAIEPISDILNAAKNSLKPMRIHNLVVLLAKNSLERIRSLTIQGACTIESIDKQEKLVLHRKVLDIFSFITNLLNLCKQLQSEVVTLFQLEKQGGSRLLKSQPIEETNNNEGDIWAHSYLKTNWPESSGTLNTLVMTLTSTESFDRSFQTTFITTYRSFTTPEQLLAKLIQRYNVPGKKQQFVGKEQVQIRVSIILKYWIENQFPDFDDDLIKELYEFIGKIKEENAGVADMLRKSLDQIIEKENTRPALVLNFSKLQTFGMSPSDLFTSSSPRDIAEQLTLISASIYKNININELLNQSWSKPKTRHKSPHVVSMIHRFNEFSFWVPTVILSFESLRERSAAFTKFIEIAKELRVLQNYDGIMGVVAGLTMSPIDRLKFSKLSVNEQLLDTFDELTAMMQPDHSWKIYREALRCSPPPAVPYLGVYLTDLTFIEDGNPDSFEVDGLKLINFKKRELVFKVLQEVQVFQSKSYEIEPKEMLSDYLRYLPHLEQDTLYEISLKREPRNATIKDLVP